MGDDSADVLYDGDVPVAVVHDGMQYGPFDVLALASRLIPGEGDDPAAGLRLLNEVGEIFYSTAGDSFRALYDYLVADVCRSCPELASPAPEEPDKAYGPLPDDGVAVYMDREVPVYVVLGTFDKGHMDRFLSMLDEAGKEKGYVACRHLDVRLPPRLVFVPIVGEYAVN